MVKKLFCFLVFVSHLCAAPKQDLYLEAFSDAETPWYPGQEGTLVYKIWYKGEIQLTKETLPLLDLPGLEKVGDKVFYEYTEDNFSIQEISQKYKAQRPGTFISPPSEINGVHTVISGGQKKSVGPVIQSVVPSYSIAISSFPELGKPDDFNGSVGSGTFEMLPFKITKTRINEWIPITIVAKGFNENSVLNPPNLDCLPGFPGFFNQDPNNLDIETDKKAGTTKFTFKITAQNRLPQAIPPILWSYFDPLKESYVTFKTKTLPISIEETLNEPQLQSINIEALPETNLAISPKVIPVYDARFSLFYRFNRHYLWIHLGLFLTIISYLLCRKPVRKAYLLFKLNRLNQAKALFRKEKNPMVIATIMDDLLRYGLKKQLRHSPQAEQTWQFIQELEEFRFFNNRTLTKKMILQKGLSLYRSLTIVLFITCGSLQADSINDHLQKGNFASTWTQRQDEWNSALQLVLQEEPTKNNLLITAFLLEQLNAKPQSLIYLKKAKQWTPNDPELVEQIQSLEHQLGVLPVRPPLFSIIESPTLKLISVILVMIAFLLLILRQRFLSIIVFSIAYSILFLIIFGSSLTPKSAVVINPTFIYDDTFKEKLTQTPLIPGDSISIVGIEGDMFNIFSSSQSVYGWIEQKNAHPFETDW